MSEPPSGSTSDTRSTPLLAESSINAGGGGAPAPTARPAALAKFGGGRGWGAMRAAHRANTIPGLDRSNGARTERLNLAEIVWKAKWQEEQRKLAAQREEAQAAQKAFGAFTSIEYETANNEVYRESLKATPPSVTFSTTMIFVVVGVVVGILGTFMRLGIEKLEAWRFSLIFDTCPEPPEHFNQTTACTAKLKTGLPAEGALIFAGVSCALILASGLLVAKVAPAAAASGLPEVIAFLNGTFQGVCVCVCVSVYLQPSIACP